MLEIDFLLTPKCFSLDFYTVLFFLPLLHRPLCHEAWRENIGISLQWAMCRWEVEGEALCSETTDGATKHLLFTTGNLC